MSIAGRAEGLNDVVTDQTDDLCGYRRLECSDAGVRNIKQTAPARNAEAAVSGHKVVTVQGPPTV